MEFTKMHGLGNDFIIIEADSWQEAANFQINSQQLCDRNFGIGADGLLVTGKDREMGVFMRIFNSDGSEPEMCGNGIRCIARYAFERGWTGKLAYSISTLAGPIYPVIKEDKGEFFSVRVDMGEPILNRAEIPMNGIGKTIKVLADTIAESFKITAVSMGNPHCIVYVDDIKNTPVSSWGPLLENHILFPAKTNVEFVQVLNRNEIIMRVWERGAGITLACGTGACASLVASVLNAYTDRKAIVHLLGGDLEIEWDEKTNHIFMTGPAQEVFRGSIDLGQAR